MAQQMIRLTPPGDQLLRLRELRRKQLPRKQSTDLFANITDAPRKRNRALPDTPSREFLSPTLDRMERQSIRKCMLLSPSDRGSPVLRQRCTSPNISPSISPNKKSPLNRSLESRSPKTFQGDRFIPNRSEMDLCRSNYLLLNKSPASSTSPGQNLRIPTIKILNFGNLSPKEQNMHENRSQLAEVREIRLKETKTPDRVLDAPGVLSDQGPHLLDWSAKNLLVLALSDIVYLWDADTHKTTMLCKSLPYTWVTAVKWSSDGRFLAIASSDGRLVCWIQDLEVMLPLKRGTRITCLAWNSNDITCGHYDGQIRHIETSQIGEPTVFCFTGHGSEIKSLSWNSRGDLLASGSAGGGCKIWSGRELKSQHTLESCTTSIAALQWCPWLNSVLATCTVDGTFLVRRITSSVTLMSATTCDFSITDLKWLPLRQAIFTSHTNGDINLWTFPTMTNVQRFKGEESGIISLSLSPDCCSLMSLGADETLRLWSSFQAEEKQDCSVSVLNKMCVR